MFRLFTALVSTALATLALVGVAEAAATVPMKERATGALVTFVPGQMSYTGQGHATHLGHYKVTGSANFDALGNVFNGQFTQVAADGSTLSGTHSGTYAPVPSGQIRFDVDLVWVSGTGRFAGATGQGDLVAFLAAPVPGGTLSYEATGSLVLP
jgi:hypothetical protein